MSGARRFPQAARSRIGARQLHTPPPHAPTALPCHRLAQLLSAEQVAFQKEIEAQYEDPAVTKQRMLDYARELQAQREADRQRIVEEKEKQRWRLSSDVLRTRDAKIVQMRIADERAAQLEEKARRAEAEAKWEAEMDTALLRANQAGAEREEAEAARHRALNAEQRAMLGAQVRMKASIAQRQKDADVAHERRLLAEWEAEQSAAEAREAARRQAAREDMKQALAFNATEQARRAEDADAERAADAARLEAVMAASKAEAAKERARAEAARQGARAHRAQLERQMAIRKAEEGALDSLHAAEQDRAWAQRQAQWDAEDAARAALQEEVHASRRQQLEQKAAAKEYEAWLDRRQQAADEERRQEGLRAEAQAAADRRAKLQQQADYARQLLREREHMRERQAQAEFLEARLQEREEARYQARVAEMLAEPPADTRWNRKKMQFT